MEHAPYRLCLILTQKLCHADPLETVEAAVAAGVDMIQVREKAMPAAELYAWGAQVLALGRRLQVPVIINDSVEVAHALDADGVHLGQSDLRPQDARWILGKNKLIGLSTHSLAQLEQAAELPVDYLGFGPIFPTSTKAYDHGLGPDLLAQALSVASIPLLAIGGIHRKNVQSLPRAAGVAASSSICSTKEIAKECLSLGRFDLY